MATPESLTRRGEDGELTLRLTRVPVLVAVVDVAGFDARHNANVRETVRVEAAERRLTQDDAF